MSFFVIILKINENKSNKTCELNKYSLSLSIIKNNIMKTYTTYKIGNVSVTKVYPELYVGSYINKDNDKMNIVVDKINGEYRGYCKEFKNEMASTTIKGCISQIESNLKFWGY